MLKGDILKLFIEIIGFLFNILGITFLYFSSIPKPWSMQSFSGQRPEEKSYENKRILQRKLGTIFLIIGMLCMFYYSNKLIVELFSNLIWFIKTIKI